MSSRLPPALASILALLSIAILVLFGPQERTLGANVRLVYLHGSWVWTALIGFGAAALSGALALVLGKETAGQWSFALGQVASFFWLTYLPISLWTMQMNWNGLFLDEPRWRVAIDFAVIAILIQLAIALFRASRVTSLLNLAYFATLAVTLANTEQVMHPPSPIGSSNSITIQLYFYALVAICLVAGWQLTRWRFQAAR